MSSISKTPEFPAQGLAGGQFYSAIIGQIYTAVDNSDLCTNTDGNKRTLNCQQPRFIILTSGLGLGVDVIEEASPYRKTIFAMIHDLQYGHLNIIL